MHERVPVSLCKNAIHRSTSFLFGMPEHTPVNALAVRHGNKFLENFFEGGTPKVNTVIPACMSESMCECRYLIGRTPTLGVSDRAPANALAVRHDSLVFMFSLRKEFPMRKILEMP